MRRSGITATAFLFTLATTPVLAVEVLDQQNDVGMSATADSASPFAVETGQTFTVGVAGTLSRIELQINKLFGTGGSAILNVYNTSGGVPLTSLGTASLNEASIPSGGFAYQSFDVSAFAIPVNVGELMAFTIKSSGEAGYGLRSTFTLDTYAGGESKWRVLSTPPGAWQSFSPSHDNGFKTYVLPSAIGTPGDFNDDGSVDAADYVVWRRNLGEADEALLSGNGDGMNGVDTGDFNLWRANFASSDPGLGALSLVVPEPSSTVLVIAFVLCCCVRRYRVRHG